MVRVACNLLAAAGLLPFGALTVMMVTMPLSAEAQPPPSLPKLVIAPAGNAGFRDLFVHAVEWPRARAMTGAILHADNSLKDFSDSELRSWFALMQMWGIRLELEVGAIKEWGPTADDTFRAEQPIWDRVISLGGDIGSFAMDEPLTAARSLLHKSDAYALVETTRFVTLVRRRFPAVQIGDVEPYPSISMPDHLMWLRQLQQQIKADGVKPLDFYRLDVDWFSFTAVGRGNWREVASLAQSTRHMGVPFSLIYWASPFPSEKARGRVAEGAWYSEVMQEGSEFAATSGRPDQFVLESWLGVPTQTVPEDAANSFTKTVLDFSEKFIIRSGNNR